MNIAAPFGLVAHSSWMPAEMFVVRDSPEGLSRTTACAKIDTLCLTFGHEGITR
jgi:hypothetical protein